MRLRKVTIPLNGVDSNIELQNTKKLHNTEPGTEQHLRRKRRGKGKERKGRDPLNYRYMVYSTYYHLK